VRAALEEGRVRVFQVRARRHNAEDMAPEGTHGRALRWREEADVDTALTKKNSAARPHVLEGEQALAPGRSLARRPEAGCARSCTDGAAEQMAPRIPGRIPPRTACRYGLGLKTAVDHHDGRRGDHMPRVAPARHHAAASRSSAKRFIEGYATWRRCAVAIASRNPPEGPPRPTRWPCQSPRSVTDEGVGRRGRARGTMRAASVADFSP